MKEEAERSGGRGGIWRPGISFSPQRVWAFVRWQTSKIGFTNMCVYNIYQKGWLVCGLCQTVTLWMSRARQQTAQVWDQLADWECLRQTWRGQKCPGRAAIRSVFREEELGVSTISAILGYATEKLHPPRAPFCLLLAYHNKWLWISLLFCNMVWSV